MTAGELPVWRRQLFLTVSEVAEVLRTDPRTVRRAIDSGDITAVRVSGVVRIPTEPFLARCGLVTPEPALHDENVHADASDERPPRSPLLLVDPGRGPPAA